MVKTANRIERKNLKVSELLLSFVMMGFFWFLIPVYKFSAGNYEYLGYYGVFSFDFARFLFASLLAGFFTLFNFRIRNDFLRLTYISSLVLLYYGELCSLICTENFNCTMIIILSVFLLLFGFIDRIKLKKNIDKRKAYRINDKTLFFLFLLCVILFLPFLAYIKDINIKNLLLEEIYDSRSAFGDISRIVGYIKEPLARVLLPLVLIISLERKQKFYIIATSLMIIYIFLCGGLKSILFGFICILFFYGGSYKRKIKIFVIALFLAEIIAVLLYYLFNVDILISIFRRLFILPPRLNQFYVEYFKNNWTYYSHSGFSLIDDPRFKGMDISHFVGEYVLGTGTNANTGIFVEGYYSFGLFGGILYLIIPIGIISYLKHLNFNNKYYGIFFVYIYYFNTSIFSTSIFTHGLLLFLIVFTVFLRNTDDNQLIKNAVNK